MGNLVETERPHQHFWMRTEQVWFCLRCPAVSRVKRRNRLPKRSFEVE